MEEQFVLVNNKKGSASAQLNEGDGKFVIQSYSGINTDCYVVKNVNGKYIKFAFFKMNGSYYVALNQEHICDYKKFVYIDKISQEEDDVLIKNTLLGNIKLSDCDIETFQKALKVMHEYMKPRRNFFKDFIEFILF
jgi:hypothetical protein